MRKATIEIKDLSIGYQTKKNTKLVAQHISSTIYSRELTCLLGANGVGKSTLLRTLSAFQEKLSGEIFIQGREITSYSDKELSTVIGVVLTDKCDFRNMTVTELVGMGRSPYTGFWGTFNSKDLQIIEKSIELMNISSLSNQMVHTLSDGERQKVMIAKALSQETPIIYLDEPTAFLDFPSKVEILQLLHQLTRQANKTIFLSTHDLELVLQIADKIWLMDKQKGIETGSPEDLSLSGSLGRFFHRKGVAFDMETGLFRVETTHSSQVRLVGDGPHYAMVKKALQRNGILASRNAESDTSIELKHPNVIAIRHGNGRNEEVTLIEDMLASIKK